MQWISDVHLNFLSLSQRMEFYEQLKGDSVLISGDIAESHNICLILGEMAEVVKSPIYFVLGNHDFYGSSAVKVRKAVKALKKPLCWLPKRKGVKLNKYTALTGQDGWADARIGDPANSRIVMNDWIYIEELFQGYAGGSQERLWECMRKLADRDAAELKKNIEYWAKRPRIEQIISVTHVPPFESCALHNGRKSTPSGLPYYTSKVIGDVLIEVADKYRHINFLHLSGHTHSQANVSVRPNLTVRVAKAEYFKPQIEAIIEL